MNFDIIFDFLKTYYLEILEVVILIISVVFCLVRKRPTYNKIDVIYKDVLSMLPACINLVEINGHGEEKKAKVISLISEYVQDKYKIQVPVALVDFISDAIEDILSTPSKK